MKFAGLIYGPHLQHLDHLAPLCALLEIPLFISEAEIGKAAVRYYPNLTVFECPALELPVRILKDYDVLLSSFPKPMIDQIFFLTEQMVRKKILPLWLPHGHSDKGQAGYYFEALEEDKMLLIYGDRMEEVLREKNVYQRAFRILKIGNFRLLYYVLHKPFYEHLIFQRLPMLFKEKKKNILYAPTWNDSENSSSFFNALPVLLENVREPYQLIVKLHPNLLTMHREIVGDLVASAEGREDVHFLLDFPPIYPLLEKVDIYVGDKSSIGYDFLYFDRPMFFLGQKNTMPLLKCGLSIEEEDYPKLYEIIDRSLSKDFEEFSDKRRELYERTFGKEPKRPKELKGLIETACKEYFEEEIH